jgi:hypothetical protein
MLTIGGFKFRFADAKDIRTCAVIYTYVINVVDITD